MDRERETEADACEWSRFKRSVRRWHHQSLPLVVQQMDTAPFLAVAFLHNHSDWGGGMKEKL